MNEFFIRSEPVVNVIAVVWAGTIILGVCCMFREMAFGRKEKGR